MSRIWSSVWQRRPRQRRADVEPGERFFLCLITPLCSYLYGGLHGGADVIRCFPLGSHRRKTRRAPASRRPPAPPPTPRSAAGAPRPPGRAGSVKGSGIITTRTAHSGALVVSGAGCERSRTCGRSGSSSSGSCSGAAYSVPRFLYLYCVGLNKCTGGGGRPCWISRIVVISLSDYASLFLFIWRVVWGVV